MEKKLELVFATTAGAKKTISVANPREGLTKDEADQAMDAVIKAKVFGVHDAPLATPVEARIRTTTIDVLA